MSQLKIDSRLQADSHQLGKLGSSSLLLMRNSLFPWFVLVPETEETEFYRLELTIQHTILSQINLVARFIENNYSIDKMNIATIGNIVSQMHMHIVGRTKKDICWPGVVWGVQEQQEYEPAQLTEIKQKLNDAMPGEFQLFD